MKPSQQEQIFFEEQAGALAAHLPDLMVEAERIAMTVTHGLHGRKRRGPGETFWQYRTYEQSDTASMIDWRRSAGTDHLYVREREWEAAHTVWLVPNLTRSMKFRSALSPVDKRSRMIVLLLAMAHLLVRGGERIGIPTLMNPSASRNAPQKLAQYLVNPPESIILPASAFCQQIQPQRFSEIILLSDFMEPAEPLIEEMARLTRQGIKGHLVQILDPAEETLPYKGRVVFEGAGGSERVLTDSAQDLRTEYQNRIIAHRATLRDACAHMQWSFQLHHTDQPAEETVLGLYLNLSGSDK